MTLASSIGRFWQYHRTHGTQATLRRMRLALQRISSAGQFVLYDCDLPVAGHPPVKGNLARVSRRDLLAAEDSHRIVSHWNPEAMTRLISERFGAHAELWLLHCDGTLAAYGWTLKGKTFEPYFFPVRPGDVHLFDFFVFPEFRGRGLNPSLVWQILSVLGQEGSKRALIEAAVWNKAQHASLARTPFNKRALAWKKNRDKSTVVRWSIAE